MRFIATADWQLGMTARFLPDDARARYQQARLDAVRRIGELAASRGAAFVVVCGDVFESNQLDRRIVHRTFEALRDCTVPVLLLPGNHDPLDAASIYDAPAFAQAPPFLHVLRDTAPVGVADGVEVVGAPWFSKEPTTDLVAEACASLNPPPPGVVRVLAGHGAVSTVNPDRDAPDAVDVDALSHSIDSGLIHVAVLGDRHATLRVTDRIWYPGTPEVTARDEIDPGNVLVVDVDAATGDVRVEPVHVGTWRFLVLRHDLRGDGDIDDLRRELAELPDKDRTAVWLALSGTLTTGQAARLDAVLDAAADLFARLDHWQRHTDLAIIPDDADFADLGLSGFARAALDDLVALTEQDAERAATASDALSLLYRFAGGVA